MPYRISKNVPIPADVKDDEGGKQSAGRPWKYRWPEMVPGDSVLLTEEKELFRSSLNKWRRLNPDQRWIMRRIEGVGIRIWRVE